MSKRNLILKSVLTGSTVLALFSSYPEAVGATEVNFEITSNIEDYESEIEKIELLNIDNQENIILLIGKHLPNTEMILIIDESDRVDITTDEQGNFEVELNTLKLTDKTFDIIDLEETNLFSGKFVKKTVELPLLTLDEITTEFITGTTQFASEVQIYRTNKDDILIPVSEDGTFTIDLKVYNLKELVSIQAIDELGNISEQINLTEIIESLLFEEEKDISVKEEENKKETNEIPTVSKFSIAQNAKKDGNGTKYHFVQSKETLYSIATAYNTTVSNLQKWNNISDPSSIKTGDLFSVNGHNVYNEIDKEKVTFTTPQSFIDYVAPYAEEIAEEYGLYTSVMIAQAIHESGWGKSDLAKLGNNLFGVKGSYDGNSVVMLTWEETAAGEVIWVQDSFRFYPTFYESIVDNAEKLRYGVTWDEKFYRGAWIENTASYYDVTEWLTGRYATDSQYATKINRTIADYDLTKYDKHINITNPITSQKWFKRVASVVSNNQNIYSQPKGTASDQLIGNTSNYVGQNVEIYQEKVNNLGTWWSIGQEGEEIGWVLREALSEEVFYTVTNTKDIEYSGTVVKPWSINTQPWGTLGSEIAADVNLVMNLVVNVIQEKTTDRATYALITINGRQLGWIDKSAILTNTDIKSTHDKNYIAEVIQPWSINTEPYGTTGYEWIMDADEFVGDMVEVSQEKVTDRSTYSLISHNGKELGWIDKKAIQELKVQDTKNVQYTAEITKPWSINSQPWGVEGYQVVDNGENYLGETLNVVQEKVTPRSTYLLLQKDGENIGWIDNGAVDTFKDVRAIRNTHYAAKVTKSWSINSQPWGTEGYKTVYGSAQQFIGQTVEVFEEKVTDRSTYALITLNGKELGWIDINGIEKQEVTATNSVNYQAEIVKPWSINSLPWGVEGFVENYSSASNFLGQIVNIKQEKVTPRSTYVLITINGEDLGWIDKGALNLYPVLSTNEVSYKAIISKPWSINTHPWGTNGFKTIVKDNSYVGRAVDIVQEKTTSRGTYGLIKENGKSIGWIDLTGVEKLEVLSTKNTHYAATVTKPWSINSQPWGVKGSEQVMEGSLLIGDSFIVTQEKVTPRSTYVLLTQNGKELGWIDTTGINKYSVNSTKDVFYTVKVTKPWSVNTQPWGIEGFKSIGNDTDYVGEIFDIIQEKKTEKGTYGLLSKTGNAIGWIDLTGVRKYSTVNSMNKVTYTAKLAKPWSINSEPWGTEGAETIYSDANEFIGRTVTVISEKVTNRSTFVLIVIDNKILGWIDKTALVK